MDIDLAKIRELRNKLRAQLPDIGQSTKISHETLSASMALLGEVLVYRIINSHPEYDAVELFRHVSKELSNVSARILKQHIPGSTVVDFFQGPKGST